MIFHPTKEIGPGGKRLRPFAYADDDGNFQVKTYVTGDGAPPGEYRVSIVAGSTGSAGPTKDAAPEAASTPAPGITIPPAITQKYGNVETAAITVQIQDGDNKLEPFQLQ